MRLGLKETMAIGVLALGGGCIETHSEAIERIRDGCRGNKSCIIDNCYSVAEDLTERIHFSPTGAKWVAGSETSLIGRETRECIEDVAGVERTAPVDFWAAPDGTVTTPVSLSH